MHAGALQPIFQRARELRNNATEAEQVLWEYLKTKPFDIKFRRQHPYSNYFLDFYCHYLKLVIEVDGDLHQLKDIKKKDKERQSKLEMDGIKIIRFSNDQVLFDTDSTLKQLNLIIQNMINDKQE